MAREILDAKADYNVIGDGTKDCTQGLLDALADATAIINQGNACTIKLPGGDICTQAPLMLEGIAGGAPCLQGADGGAFDLSCTRLKWTGPLDSQGNPQGTVLKTKAFNRGRIRRIGILLGNASVGLWATAPTDLQHASTSGANFERITVGGMVPGRIAIQFGTDPELTQNQTYQFSESHWHDINIIGSGGIGIHSLSPGNCKNHEFERLNLNGLDTALDLNRGSGMLRVTGLIAGNCGTIAKCSGGQLKVTGYEVECSGKPFRLLTGTMDWSTSCSFESGEVSWSDPSGVGVLMDVASAIHFARSQFMFRDASGNIAPFRMHHNRAVDPGNCQGSFISEQCTYWGCGDDSRPYIPIFDGGGNDLSPQPGAYGTWPGINPRVASKFDMATRLDGTPMQLKSFGWA